MTADPRQPGDDHVRDDEAPDPALSAAWAALKAQRARVPDARAIDALEQLAQAATTEEAREAALLQAMEGGHADGVALLHTMHAAAREATARDGGQIQPVPVSPWRRWRTTVGAAGALAAAAAVVLVVRPSAPASTLGAEAGTMRGGVETLVLESPRAGERISDSTRFQWRAVADARAYDITWFDANGTPVVRHTSPTPDYRVTGGDSVTSPRVVMWQVEAVLIDGRRLASPMQPLNGR